MFVRGRGGREGKERERKGQKGTERGVGATGCRLRMHLAAARSRSWFSLPVGGGAAGAAVPPCRRALKLLLVVQLIAALCSPRQPGGPTSRAKNLLVGDVLVEINDCVLFAVEKNARRWFEHAEVIEVLTKAGSTLKMLVAQAGDLERIGPPLARAVTLSERQAAVAEGYIQLKF